MTATYTTCAWASAWIRVVFLLAATATVAGEPAEIETESVEAGLRAYSTYCATCHGDNLVNNGNASFDLRRLTPSDRMRFENSVTNGKGQMPPWRGVLSTDDIDKIWKYVMSMHNS